MEAAPRASTAVSSSPPASPTAAAPPFGGLRSTPLIGLTLGLVLVLLTILVFSLYTVRGLRNLRDQQTAISERNRLDALQIVRIQHNLSALAATLRDMVEGTEPYPMAAWANTFARLRGDLDQALQRERELAPADRTPAEQARLADTVARFWASIDAAFARAREGNEAAAAEIVRREATARHSELASLVSQLLISNSRSETEGAARARAVYDRVAREIYALAAVLLGAVGLGGWMLIRATHKAFATIEALSAERRALSWRMLRMQEDLQTSLARELHDEFGQILTALGMMLARVKKSLSAASAGSPASQALVGDLEEVQRLAQDTLERIRTRSRLLHPVVLDDFGLQQTLTWYAEQFERQHSVRTTFDAVGHLEGIEPDTAIHLYRIVQEALTNIARHAGATRVRVRLSHEGDRLALTVDDNGRGLREGEAPSSVSRERGLGITSMRERAELLGGQFIIGRSAEGGVHVEVSIPRER
jgi:signal transduction histidine kinase